MLKSLLFLAILPMAAQAATIFAPGNQIFGIQSNGTNFLIATQVGTGNGYPANESPDHAIDGVGQKYLNFGKTNTGIMASPSGGSSVVTSLQVWTANDAVGRDPASYAVYGTNQPLNAGGMALASFTLISTGTLALPGVNEGEFRNAGGAVALNPANSATVNFANTTAYANYAIIFPTLKNEPGVNSMQVAEVQLFGNFVPEPGSAMLAGVGALMLARRRRK
jgi:hypothetical protein